MKNTEIKRYEKESHKNLIEYTFYKGDQSSVKQIKVYECYESGNAILDEICRKQNAIRTEIKLLEENNDLMDELTQNIISTRKTEFSLLQKIIDDISNNLELRNKWVNHLGKSL